MMGSLYVGLVVFIAYIGIKQGAEQWALAVILLLITILWHIVVSSTLWMCSQRQNRPSGSNRTSSRECVQRKLLAHPPFMGRCHVRMYVWSHMKQKYPSTGSGCQSCSWSAEQGKLIFPFPRSLLRICSRETGSAVPSRVSLFISILRLNLVLTYGIPPEFRGGVHLFI